MTRHVSPLIDSRSARHRTREPTLFEARRPLGPPGKMGWKISRSSLDASRPAAILRGPVTEKSRTAVTEDRSGAKKNRLTRVKQDISFARRFDGKFSSEALFESRIGIRSRRDVSIHPRKFPTGWADGHGVARRFAESTNQPPSQEEGDAVHIPNLLVIESKHHVSKDVNALSSGSKELNN